MKTLLCLLVLTNVLLGAEGGDTLAIGSQAPDFKLKNVDGEFYSLANFKDSEVLVVIFTCNHCPDARAARGRIKQLHADYENKGVSVVTISGNDALAVRIDELGWSIYGDSFEDGVQVAKEEGYQFPFLYDGDTQVTTAAYGAKATPHAFVLDKERVVRYTGRLDDMKRKPGKAKKSYIREALDAVLKGQTPDPAVTRAVGCSIKWKSKRGMVAKYDKDWNAQEVTLVDMDVAEAAVVRKNESGNLRLINFWSTTCAPCLQEFPSLVQNYRRYQTRPFDFITISLDVAESRDQALKFLKGAGASLSKFTKPSLEKEKRRSNNYFFTGSNPDLLAEAIDPEWSGALPYSILINGDGKIVFRHEGEIDPLTLRRAIIGELDKRL